MSKSSATQSNLQGALFALLAFGLFSTHDVLVKFLGGSYSTFQIVFFSVLFGFPLATTMLMQDSTDGNLRPRRPLWVAARALASSVSAVSVFYAFSRLPLAQVYAILFTTPLLITVLAIPILGETVRLRRWIAVLVGLCGVFIVLRPGTTDLQLAHAAALLGAFASALASIIVRKIGQEERSVVLLLYPMMCNVILMGAILPFVYEPMPLPDLGAQVLVAVLMFCAMLCVIAAYRLGEAVVVAPMQYSQILWATFFGFIFFGETLDRATAIGAAVIIGSGLYILLREGRSAGSSTTPVLRTRTRFDPGTTLRAGPMLRRKRGQDQAGEDAGPGGSGV